MNILRMTMRVGPICLLAALGSPFPAIAQTNSFPVTIRVDASRPLGPLRPIWRFFGGDEPNYATMKDGQKLLAIPATERRP